MKSGGLYTKWLEDIARGVPQSHRVGDDILLIDDYASCIDVMPGAEPFRVDMTMAIICEQGSASVKVNMRDCVMQAPSVVIVLCGQMFQLLHTSPDLRCKVILMSQSFSDSLFVRAGEAAQLHSSMQRNPVHIIGGNVGVFEQFYGLLQNIASSPESEFVLDAARHLTLSMFYGYTLATHDVASTAAATTRQQDIYSAFLDCVGEHYRRERGVAFYAGKLCLTPKYLSQVVVEVSGRSPLDIIEEYVVAECKALLSGTMTVSQVSDELNFSSQSVFGKYFKRVTGMSPREYKERRN